MFKKNKLSTIIAGALVLCGTSSALEINQEGNNIVFDSIEKGSYKLRVLDTYKEIHTFDVKGKYFVLSADMLGQKSFSDGSYKFELSPYTPSNVLASSVRELNDKEISNEYIDAFKSESKPESGTFTITNNNMAQQIEESANKDIVQNDDVIVTFSLCAGNDCVNGENFGFDTIRMKENNLRLHFQDTSSSASFPTNDWRIVANDSSNGGANYLAFEDSNSGRQLFRVDAGAPANSLYVDSQGDVGLGTNTPVVNFHVKEGNTPTLRLEQDGSSGFTSQTFDIAANEANFFIRDVTNGSKLFFRAKPGAPEDSLFIAADGDIGLGTDGPGSDLHVRAGGSAFSADASTVAHFQNNAATTDVARISIISGDTGNAQLSFGDASNEFAGRVRYNQTTETMDFLTSNTRPLTLDGTGSNIISNGVNGAVLTAAGVWQDSSSRSAKKNIKALSIKDAQRTLDGLDPVTYIYKTDPDKDLNVGFIAEEVPEMVATSSRKTLASLDIIAVLTKVVQGQKNVISKLESRIEKLEKNK